MRMRKFVLDLSVAQIVPEKINKMFLPKELGFIDVLSTVCIILNWFFVAWLPIASFDLLNVIICSASYKPLLLLLIVYRAKFNNVSLYYCGVSDYCQKFI